ncbi:unnamed protein product [Rotaria sp. Silwood2]|nr:unnamed protein product [Rotaria sp. Silwood2]CAF4643059.1 unnamed protein product [Rotaria sp. Silwood2]
MQTPFYINQQEFARLWQNAQRQGWHLSPRYNNVNVQMVLPPENHPAALNSWAAIYSNVNYGNQVLRVPHWFYSEVGRNSNYSQHTRSPKNVNCSIS